MEPWMNFHMTYGDMFLVGLLFGLGWTAARTAGLVVGHIINRLFGIKTVSQIEVGR
jgi:hypothetical protein